MSKSNNSTVMIDGKEFDVADLEYVKNLLDTIDLRPIPSKINPNSHLIHKGLTLAVNPYANDEYSVKYAPGVKERVEPSRRLKKQNFQLHNVANKIRVHFFNGSFSFVSPTC